MGLTFTFLDEGLSFTLEAKSAPERLLPGTRQTGPAAQADPRGSDPTDEKDWAWSARAEPPDAISSTLTLPIRFEGRVVASVDLYAADPRAFEGHHRLVAAVFGAWGQGAVSNADLDFETRRAAQRAPALLRAQADIDRAVGLLVASRGVAPEVARQYLEDSALLAKVEPVVVARRVIDSHQRRTD